MKYATSIMILIIIFCCCANVLSFNTVVRLPLGKINGYVTKTKSGKEFVAFDGIPYAKPPVGELRFEEPQPVNPWSETLMADKLHVCIQYNHLTPPGEDMVQGEEDCLHLNVYTPNIDDNLRDVIIFIHGGAFMFGSGASYGPYIIMDHDIVFVTINYRLGPLGFLSTEDSVVPGNNGIKDQLLALKWISKYIKYFGGNPNSITLTGMSAGGASTQIHALSPLSKGLFHRGISQSGCVMNPWVLVENSLEKAQKISSHLNCPISTTKEMISCLKEKRAYDIVASVKLMMAWLYNPISPFAVVVDKWSANPILKEHPAKLLSEGKVSNVPWMFSHVEAEGLYPGSDFIAKNEYLEEIDNNWDNLIPHILELNYTLDTKAQPCVLEKIRKFYFYNDKVSAETYDKLIKMMSDRMFIVGLQNAAKLQSIAVQSPIYYYYFSYRGAHSKSELRSLNNNNYGAAHGDDTVYILWTYVDSLSTENDRKMSEVLVNMWINFASTGVPKVGNVEWTQISKENHNTPINYLHIKDYANFQMKRETSFGNAEFWERLPIQENIKINEYREEL